MDDVFKIKMPALPAWTIAEDIGYTPKTTFWQDFSIADLYGLDAVQDTFNRAFNEWKSDHIYLTELVLVVNHKSWQHAENRPDLAELYEKLYYQADEYALDNLKGDALTYYIETTD